MELFVVNGGIGHLSQSKQTKSGWGSWKDWPAPVFLSGLVSAPTVIQNTNGELQLFVLSLDGYLWHRGQFIWVEQFEKRSFWEDWIYLGAQDHDQTLAPQSAWPPAAVVGSDDLIDVYAITNQYAIAHIWEKIQGFWNWNPMNSGCF
ncbi:MAG: hypothetical protein KGI25_04935 [Thaumarchaeota archaeon]|nr:hypothetical protein [Nitrososphaerota archaeon]